MRTTLDIDEDVLEVVRELADLQNVTCGKFLSDLARESFRATARSSGTRNGVPLIPSRGAKRPVTLRAVNRLRDE